ncbi:MAG: hypothetical protein NUW37_04320 [Planctomycetes bacterium]|nr:hypothetical protein [Planctomycetota bacterium]
MKNIRGSVSIKNVLKLILAICAVISIFAFYVHFGFVVTKYEGTSGPVRFELRTVRDRFFDKTAEASDTIIIANNGSFTFNECVIIINNKYECLANRLVIVKPNRTFGAHPQEYATLELGPDKSIEFVISADLPQHVHFKNAEGEELPPHETIVSIGLKCSEDIYTWNLEYPPSE